MSQSRRQFLTASSLALVGGALAPGRLFGWQPAAPEFKTAFTPLRRNVGIFTGRGGTIGWLIAPSALVVVDTQYADSAPICLDGIRQRASGRTIDRVINTHHHGDHTGGNAVFKPAARRIVAHARVPELQRQVASQPPAAGQAAPPAPTLPDATYTDVWSEALGDERVALRYYGPAHTGGDSVVHFEKANVVHMGDLVFNRRTPFVDRPGGAVAANWIALLEKVMAAHDADTMYIFGHAGEKFPVTGTKADLGVMRDYLSALMEHVRAEVAAGKPREAIVKSTDVLKGFPDHGPLHERALAGVYDELTAQ